MTRLTAAVVVIVLCLLVGGLFGRLLAFGGHTGAATPHALDQQP
ncbi:hypothetical protein ACVOMV_17185 [Mesorhizobium atlanticum]